MLYEVITGIPLVLSSGVSRLGDIERAMAATEAVAERILLHCVTSYPAPETDYNLRLLGRLSGVFGIPTGVSDHSLDPVLVPALAVCEGAAMIEKHICLSRNDPGLDDPVALPPDQFAALCKAVREAARRGPEATREALTKEYGAEKTEAVLGDGIKRLAPSERANYGRTNRSLHFTRDMRAGETLTGADVAPVRTEKVLRVVITSYSIHYTKLYEKLSHESPSPFFAFRVRRAPRTSARCSGARPTRNTFSVRTRNNLV